MKAAQIRLHDQHPEVTPIYDDVGNFTGWRGSACHLGPLSHSFEFGK